MSKTTAELLAIVKAERDKLAERVAALEVDARRWAMAEQLSRVLPYSDYRQEVRLVFDTLLGTTLVSEIDQAIAAMNQPKEAT